MRKSSDSATIEESSNDDEQIIYEDIAENGEDSADTAGDGDENLDASATESDEDECETDSDDADNKDDVETEKSKDDKIKELIFERYQERQGKQLYIRFPHKVPETQESLEKNVKEIAPLVVKVHKPRQRHARFCLVDFATKEDRDATLNMLKKSIKKGELLKYAVNIPRTESSDFVNELAERKIQSIEKKKAKLRLKKESKKSMKESNFTSTVIVLNLPKSASMLQIRELFPNAVDINVKPGKGKLNRDKSIAAITFPTTMDARNAVVKKLQFEGTRLLIKFDNKNYKKKQSSRKGVSKNRDSTNLEAEPTEHQPETQNLIKNNVKRKKIVNKKSKLVKISK